MTRLNDPFGTLQKLKSGEQYFSLKALEEKEKCGIDKLPVTIRIMLESLLRNCDGKRVKQEDVKQLARWNAKRPQDVDVPFVVSRVILQDFTGVPLLVDLASMRDAVAKEGKDPSLIEPQVPVDLVVDHSVQVDQAGTEGAFLFNINMEFQRNRERYAFLKWGQDAFETFKVVPPGIGIVHQVNLEHIAHVVTSKEGVAMPDTLVGTDSHTTMINGLGVVGWGVGGIEAEAAMLGQPVYLRMPEVIGVHLKGELQNGVTATDLTLRITQMLREENVVGKFVEYFGKGAASLTVADRATIANMSPEYGATMGFFPVDEKSLDYMRLTGRDEKQIELVKNYLSAQNLYGIPKDAELTYTKTLELDLNQVTPCVSGPKRPQDRIDIPNLKRKFEELLASPIAKGGYNKPKQEQKTVRFHTNGSFSFSSPHETGGKADLESPKSKEEWSEEEMVTNRPVTSSVVSPGYVSKSEKKSEIALKDGSVVIAAITSCTNTSNPSVMMAAGLLAKKAVEKGLGIKPYVKTSLAPGSRVVTDYLDKTGLQKYLDDLGFQLVAYGCTTCIGNSGPLDEHIEKAIKENNLITASVLSGNRNFEARIHSSVKANFLMSPPLVVAYAIAGTVAIDLDSEPLGNDTEGNPVFLKDIWPSVHEIHEEIKKGIKPEMFKERYLHVTKDSPVWKEIPETKSALYHWDKESTYIQNPPYFEHFSLDLPKLPSFKNMRALALFGDSVTTDHISPAGAIKADSPAGQYLISHGVKEANFNSYGSRRGNHNVMMRGTFGNVRIRNQLAGDTEGGFTKLMPEGTLMPIFDACQEYKKRHTPLIIFAGRDYGMGSSRDWAAKGTVLLGVHAVVAQSFERIHRSNLIGMGVLPLQFKEGEGYETLGIEGDEEFTLVGIDGNLQPSQEVALEIKKGGKTKKSALISRLDTASEIEYYKNGGIMPFVLRHLLEKN